MHTWIPAERELAYLTGAKAEGICAQERAYGFHANEWETAVLLSATPQCW